MPTEAICNSHHGKSISESKQVVKVICHKAASPPCMVVQAYSPGDASLHRRGARGCVSLYKTQTESRSVQPLVHGSPVCLPNANTQNAERSSFVATGRIYRERKDADNYNEKHNIFIFKTAFWLFQTITLSECCLKNLFRIRILY